MTQERYIHSVNLKPATHAGWQKAIKRAKQHNWARSLELCPICDRELSESKPSAELSIQTFDRQNGVAQYVQSFVCQSCLPVECIPDPDKQLPIIQKVMADLGIRSARMATLEDFAGGGGV